MTALGIWGWKGSIFDLVRWHNERQAVDACLYRLARCLNVTCTNRPTTGCYNMLESWHYPPLNTLAPSWRLCVLSTGNIERPHGKNLCPLTFFSFSSGVLMQFQGISYQTHLSAWNTLRGCSLSPLHCAQCKITYSCGNIWGPCIVIRNQGCLQLPIILLCWLQHTWFLPAIIPGWSLTCAYTVQRHETLGEHLPWREVGWCKFLRRHLYMLKNRKGSQPHMFQFWCLATIVSVHGMKWATFSDGQSLSLYCQPCWRMETLGSNNSWCLSMVQLVLGVSWVCQMFLGDLFDSLTWITTIDVSET